MQTVLLAVTRGVPFARTVRITGGTSIWATLDDFEVRAQVRAGRSELDALVADLGPYLSVSLDGADILIVLALSGAETRALAAGGFYDILLSDVGTTDARALKVLAGQLTVNPTVTAA